MNEHISSGTFLGALTPGERTDLERLGQSRIIERGDTLFHEGDPSNFVVLILQGRVKVSSVAESGARTLLAIRAAGDVVGEMAAIDGQPRSANVSALMTAYVRIISVEEFRAFLDAHPEVLRVLLKIGHARLRDADRKRVEHRGLDVLGRIARLLLDLSETDGHLTLQSIPLDLSLTHQELGEWVGASLEAVAKALRVLREQGAIETRRGAISVVRPELLGRLASPPGSGGDPLLRGNRYTFGVPGAGKRAMGHGSDDDRHAPRESVGHVAHEPESRLILVVDIEGFGSPERNGSIRAGLRQELYRLLENALEQGGASPGDCVIEDRGDGALILVRPNVPKVRLLGTFVITLAAGLRRHNSTTSSVGVMRLRTAMNSGEVVTDAHGAIGRAVDATFRLVDAEPLRAALRSSDADLAVIVSDGLYQDIIRQWVGPIAASEYWEVAVDVKEYHAWAWITLRPLRSAPVARQSGSAEFLPSTRARPPRPAVTPFPTTNHAHGLLVNSEVGPRTSGAVVSWACFARLLARSGLADQEPASIVATLLDEGSCLLGGKAHPGRRSARPHATGSPSRSSGSQCR